jgi:hypothetical protein
MLRLRCLATSVFLLVGLLGIAAVVGLNYSRPALDRWTASEGFQTLISREVSRAMKVDGTFGPIQVEGWSATTPSYTSEGWPGEAIGSLNAKGIQAVFNPWAIFRRVWQVDRIHIEQGTFALRLPDDALKRPAVKGQKPWYAILMPTRFYCPEIICPAAQVEFPFQGQTGRLQGLNLRARMIGQDFEYRADAGRFVFPLFPEMQVDELNLFITREMADIRIARLSGLDGDPGRAIISARLGMREDKSIRAKVELDQLPFGRALPSEWVERLDGRLTGKLDWDTDGSGLKTASDGVVHLRDVVVQGWSWLDRLAAVHDNPDLKVLKVPEANCRFAFDGRTFQLRNLNADAGNLLAFRGDVDYTAQSQHTRANLTLDRFDLKRWLPADFKHRVEAQGKGHVFWEGSWKDPLNSTASGQIYIPACTYRFRPQFLAALKRYGVHFYPDIELDGFDVEFSQSGPRFDVTHIGLLSQRGLRVEGYGHWVVDQSWELHVNVSGIHAELWRPSGGEGRVRGRVDLTGTWASPTAQLGEGRGRGTARVQQARLTDFTFQKTLARFLKDPSLRDLQFRDFELTGEGDRQDINIQQFRMFTPGKIGLEGTARTTADGRVSGAVWLGLPTASLNWLPEAETAVFTRKKDGLSWAKVTLGGTTRKLEQDLSAQILRVLRRHPLTLAGLGVRAVSWWLGDVLGTYEEDPLTPARP